jgi:hypothetical protein
VNLLAILVARKRLLRPAIDVKPNIKRPTLALGCITLIILAAGFIILSHISLITNALGDLFLDNQQNRQLRSLQDARGRWATRSFSDYHLSVDVKYWSSGNTTTIVRTGNAIRVVDIGELVEHCAYTLEIENDDLIATTRNSCSSTPLYVGDFFQEIEQTITQHQCGPNGCRCDGFIDVDVVYDSESGFPKTMKISLKQEHHLSTFLADPHGLLPSGCTMVGWGLVLPEYSLTLTPHP